MADKRKDIEYFRINVRTKDRLDEAQAFARSLRLSGIDVAQWFFEQVDEWKRRESEKLTHRLLTAQGAIEFAWKKFGIEVSHQDLQYWRNKPKLPKLRLGYDYVEFKRGFLYKRDKLARILKIIAKNQEIERENELKKGIFSENQEWTADVGAFRVTEAKKLSGGMVVQPIVVHREDDGE